jgi:hypothetical protein
MIKKRDRIVITKRTELLGEEENGWSRMSHQPVSQGEASREPESHVYVRLETIKHPVHM